ncbi:hypothetical protein [Nocardioides sp. YIM 152315]|uniref:hypothetical protein n=1 Tax=Nocardioides sp. YIM 152315 TaxID=3031760 RepID=UPI0023DA96FE|nr:hypothetical protein [Nocardioides sp. YIM 152315]MDF1602183.1 hypothetical protein [Nocardioides sp. YIM 152315]
MARSERPGEGETGLLSELLGLATGGEHADHTLALPALLRLSQPSGYVRSGQVLMAEVHLGVL